VCIQLGLSGSKRGVGTAIRVRGRQLGASKVGTCREDILMVTKLDKTIASHSMSITSYRQTLCVPRQVLSQIPLRSPVLISVLVMLTAVVGINEGLIATEYLIVPCTDTGISM